MSAPAFLSPADVARRYGVHPLTVYGWIKFHGLPATQPGGKGHRLFIAADQLDAWWATRTRGAIPGIVGSPEPEPAP
jgi:excisionase family DNA binding protein